MLAQMRAYAYINDLCERDGVSAGRFKETVFFIVWDKVADTSAATLKSGRNFALQGCQISAFTVVSQHPFCTFTRLP